MIKYYKNFILCGEIDFFCLVCEESFQYVEDVEKHIRWEKHRKILKSLEYFPKFKKELVYKLETKYYCETCNFVAPKFDAIKTHIKEESHAANKANPPTELKVSQAKRELNNVTIGKSVIKMDEWHGIFGKECVVCHSAVQDVDDHVGSSGHMVNLIRSKLKCEKEEQYYRELDNNTFYCFTCKKIYPNDSLNDHWNNEMHTGIKSSTGDSEGKCIQYFDVDKEKGLVTCRICKKTLLFNLQSVYRHRDLHRDTTLAEKKDETEVYEEAFRLLLFPDHGKLRHELKLYGKDNHIKLISGGAKGYCNICFTYISAHMMNFKEHVKGARHQGFLQTKGLIKKTKKPEKPKYTTKPLIQYIQCLQHVKEISAFWLNKELCVSVFSFIFLSPLDHDKDKMRCFLCEKVISSEIAEHFQLVHSQDYVKTRVITTFEDEFIREIRPGLYHCGFCNQIFPDWEILIKHFKSWKHKSSTMNAMHMFKFAMCEYFNCPLESMHIMNAMDILNNAKYNQYFT